MKINENDLKEYLENEEDIIEIYIVMKIYERYKNTEKYNNYEYTFVDMKIAYNNLLNIFNNKSNNLNSKLKDRIKQEIIVLKNNINNFSQKDIKQHKKILKSLTILDIMLDNNISYPEMLNIYLKEKLNNKVRR